jgi:hypothetical protein
MGQSITRRSLSEGVKGRRPSDYGEDVPHAYARGRADDWIDGAPPGLDPEILALDMRLYKHARCPRCQRRTLGLRPQHRRRSGAYRILGTCRACKYQEAF